MRKGKKDIPVVTRFTSFFEFSLVDTNSPANNQRICRLEFEIISGEQCPKATENFRQLTSGVVTVGEKKAARQACYKGTRLLRCTPEMIQLGDTVPISTLLGSTAGNTGLGASVASGGAGGGAAASKVDNSARGQQAQAEKDAANALLLEGKTQDTIYGTLIEDEAFGVVPHRFGTLTLCNSGPNTNGSQFSIIVGGEGQQQQENDNKSEVDPVTTNFSFLDNRHISLGYLRSEVNPSQFASAVNSTQGEALRKLHSVASSLAVDKTGRLSATSGSYIMISDCGVMGQ